LVGAVGAKEKLRWDLFCEKKSRKEFGHFGSPRKRNTQEKKTRISGTREEQPVWGGGKGSKKNVRLG